MNIQNKFKKTNTIYKITKDMNLEGSTLIIPVGCTLDFQGGSFKNGTINFNDTLLKGRVNINCDVITGTIKNEQIYVNWFNVDNTGISENTALINYILQTAANKTVIFDGVYKIDPIASSSKEYDGGIRPVSNQTLKFTDGSKLIIDKQSTLYFSILSIYRVENVSIYGANIEGDINTHNTNQGEYGFGVAISSSKNINLYNCKSSYNWGDGYIFLSTGSEESNNFNCNLYNCEAHYNRRQGLSIVALYGGRIDNFKATNTGILKYTAPAAGIDIEPDAIRYDERIKVVINNYTSENNFGGALHIIPAHLMHDNVTDNHREFYVQVNGLSSNLDGSRNTSVLLPALRYSSVTTDSNLQNKIKGLVELNNITISNSYMNPLEFRNMVDNGLPIVINNLTVLNPKVDSSFAKSMSAVLKFYNPTTYDYTNSTELTINGIKVTDTRTDNRVSYLMFSAFDNSPKNIHLFNVGNPSMEGGSNIPYFIDDSSEIHYSVPPMYTVNNDDDFLLSDSSNNYWGYKIIFNNPSVKSFRLPKGSTVSNFEITIENIQEENVVHSRFIPGDKINEPLVYNQDPSFELLPNSSIRFIQRKDKSWDVYKSTDDIIPTLNPYYGSSKQAVAQYSNPILGHSYYDTNLDTTLNYGNDGWQNPDGTNTDKVIFASRNTSFVASKTIYKITSDIDLNGETLTLPANVTLDFQGGSFSNGTIIGSDTKIRSGLNVIFDNITIGGTWDNDNCYLEWFNPIDSKYPINEALKLSKSLQLLKNTYPIVTVSIPDSVCIQGESTTESIISIDSTIDIDNNNIILKTFSINPSDIFVGDSLIKVHSSYYCVFEKLNMGSSKVDTAIIFDGTDSSYYHTITNCNISSFNTGIKFTGHANANNVLYNNFYLVKTNIVIDSCNGLRIIGNTFQDFKVKGIDILYSTGSKPVGNSISSNYFEGDKTVATCDIDFNNTAEAVDNMIIGNHHTYMASDKPHILNMVGPNTIIDSTRSTIRNKSYIAGIPTLEVIEKQYINALGADYLKSSISPIQIDSDNMEWWACIQKGGKRSLEKVFTYDNSKDWVQLDKGLIVPFITQYYGQGIILGYNATLSDRKLTFDSQRHLLKYGYDSKWNYVSTLLSGTTANRPNANLNMPVGLQYFDTTISKPIYWTGTGWVDSTGVTV